MAAAANFQTKPNTWRIVLLGKTGSGKSSLANTILGAKDEFKVYHTSKSGTATCGSKTKTIDGREIQLIDTPGVFDTKPDSPDLSPEMLKCIIKCSPGPHAFLLVFKVERFTKHELSVADTISDNFSPEALKYTTVVFTQGDQLEEGVKIEDWVKDNEALKNLVEKCGGRCHVFDNKYWKNSEDQYRNNQVQLKELLETINKTVKENGGKFYTNENLKMVQEEKIQQNALIRAQAGNMSEREIEEKTEANTLKSLMMKIGGLTGVLAVGALIGVALLKTN